MICVGPRTGGLVCAAVAFGLDQATKQIALASLEFGGSKSVAPFLTLTLGLNEGVSFGMFATWFSGRPLLLAGVTMAIVALVAVWLWQARSRFRAIALGTILGGALGNISDRVRIGAVVDYLDFHAWGYHWPAFNFADAAILCGVATLVLTDFVPVRGSRNSPNGSDP